MPFERPTLTRLIEQAQADVAGELGLYSLLRFSPERAFATAQAGLTQGCYGMLDWIALQATPFTATDEYAEAWAALIGVTRKGSSAATGYAAFTGTPNAVLPAGTPVARSLDGVQYVTTAAGTVGPDGTVTVPIGAAEASAAGDALDGTPLVLGQAVPGINAAGLASGAISGGADLETDDEFRTRYLEAYANPPQGGAASDYVRWAKEVAGVTRAWAVPNGAGAGTVSVYVMLDDARADSGGFPTGADGVATNEPRGTPATGDQLAVADHLFAVQPVTALVTVYSPSAMPVAFTIGDVPDASLQPAIAAALDAVFLAKAAVGGTMYPSDFTAALKGVSGLTRFSMPVPSGPVTAGTGRLPVRGTITWT